MKAQPEPALAQALARDGRIRRGERSRQAIVGALLDLIGGGVLQPTVQQVADRAGVGLRSVFRHFSESETLYAAMDAGLQGAATRIIAGGQRDGSLDERLAALVQQRADLFERIAPYKRSANLQRWRSRFLQERHQFLQRALSTDLRRWLPELDGAPADLFAAVDLATSFEAWDRLRDDRQLSRKVASAAVTRTGPSARWRDSCRARRLE